MKILVTGGTGFIGQTVLRMLLRRGHEIVATSRRISDDLARDGNLKWVRWDGAREALPEVPYGNLKAILHLAASTNPAQHSENANEVYQLSAGATLRFLEAARLHGVSRLLVASTGDVLGSNPQGAREHDVHYAPTSFYGTTKACAELLVRSYEEMLSTAILRFYHPYGPGGDRFLVNRLVHWVAEGREIKIEGEDGIRVNPVWIEDLALGVCQAVESDRRGVFHFAGPQTMSLKELVLTIGKLVGRAPVIRTISAPCNQRHVGSFELTARILGYRPKVSLEEGLTKMLSMSRKAELIPFHQQEAVTDA
jgi:nucleoside-diphosphate-sugar epimerase